MIPLLPTGPGDDRGATQYGGGIALVRGLASVRIGEQETTLEPAMGLLRFSPSADAPSAEPQPLDSLPDWLKLETDSTSAIVRRYAALFEDEFIQDQPVSQSIRPVVKDRRPPLSELATQTLALTGSYHGLVDGLSAPHEESRIAAIKGLMAWLPLNPDHSEQLKVELNNRFREDVAEALHRLLWGYSEEQARNQIDSEDLVRFLEHEEIAVRELAFFHINRLTGRRYDYRPNDPPAQREAAVQRWRRYLEENGALISP
jgi:hypothetical protein